MVEELLGDASLYPCVSSGRGNGSAHYYVVAGVDRLPTNTVYHVSPETVMVTIGGEGKQRPAWQVEILSTGKQAVVPPSIHPDTGERYRWTIPLNGSIPELPEAAYELLRVTRREERKVGDSGRGNRVIDDRTVKDLRSALTFIRSDDRDLWVRMGHALKELGNVGRGLWIEWSQTSEKYDPQDAARVWDSLKSEHTDYRAVFAEAQRQGWVNPAYGKDDGAGGTFSLDGDEIRCTDLGNARRLINQHGDDIHYCWPWAKWLIWDGSRWQIDETGKIHRLAEGGFIHL